MNEELEAVRLRIPEQLQALRKESGLTLRDVAARTGLSQSMISQLEHGKTNPSLPTLMRLSKVFNYDFPLWFRYEPEME